MKKKFLIASILLLTFFPPIFCSSSNKPLKVLHMSYHMGCIKDFEDVAKELGFELFSWHIFSYPINWLDGVSTGFDIYNITHDKADKIWHKHKAFFEQFDVIVTSDTPPLARPFLQNNVNKPTIVWLCNRLDYDHGATQEFPDKELYSLFNQAAHKAQVKIVGYTMFEHTYALQKGVDTGTAIIKPLGSIEMDMRFTSTEKSVPQSVDKPNTLFVYPQINNEQYRYVYTQCKELGLPVHTGRYNGPNDLTDFKGILYIPYQVSNLILFEGMHRGFVFFVPSKKFLRDLIAQNIVRVCCYFNPELYLNDFIDQMEWYLDMHKDLFVYFDSWEDLKTKIETTNYSAIRKSMKLFGAYHRHVTLEQWKNVFKMFKSNGYLK